MYFNVSMNLSNYPRLILIVPTLDSVSLSPIPFSRIQTRRGVFMATAAPPLQLSAALWTNAGEVPW